MNFQVQRIFLRSTILHGISLFPKCLPLRCYSAATKQEFGRHFEEVVVKSLRRYSFDVAVCGGPKDRGIDFRGVWLLKVSPVLVIGQCRRYKRRLGPKHVRELEGTLTHEAKGTLGIIVTECGYSKDAYGVFMGSLYPIALTTLKGYSDEVLQWFFDQENVEKHGSTNQDAVEHDLALSVHYTSSEGHSSRDSQIVDRYVNSNHLEMNEEGEANTKEGNDCLRQHPATDQEKTKSAFRPNCIEDSGNPELNSSLGFDDECSYLKTRLVDDELLTNDFTDVVENLRQSANSNISDLGSGIFTMFELNPAARKLLPHLVVGMKYRRRNSKAPELFINEDNSFVSLPE